MQKVVIILFLVLLCTNSVYALELEAPAIPPEYEEQMPEKPASFAEGLSQIIWKAMSQIRPDLIDAFRMASGFVCITVMVCLVGVFPGNANRSYVLIGTVAFTMIFLNQSQGMVSLAITTIKELSEYNKLLLPVLTTALAAQGGITSSTALYVGNAAFNSFLSAVLSNIAVTIIYIYIIISAVHTAVGEDMLKKLKEQLKKFSEWFLKVTLGAFSSYIGLIGLVSGTTDRVAVKAAKTAITAAVPVVGSTLAGATETILNGAALTKNTIGIYGIYGVMAIFFLPFLRIGCHYLILKLTCLICSVFDCKELSNLVEDFSFAMGLLLAMIASLCVMQLIGMVCFMKGCNS